MKTVLILLVMVLLCAAAWLFFLNRQDRAQVDEVWQALEATREASPSRYDPSMVVNLPEVAQRYFSQAIEPGTPLQRVVKLEMEGQFVLNGNSLPMTARQILAPNGHGFVWAADIGSGLMRFSGSDGFHAPSTGARQSWTTFWLSGVLPLARIGGNDDHARAAATRLMLESVWAPASLLPQFGAHWTQTGEHTAEVRLDALPYIEPMEIRLDEDGRLHQVQALRWSDANRDKTYRLQPFGGRMLELTRHGGFLVPTRVELGNHFGTPDYEPFFMATVTDVAF
jgi:hypothetical protein